MGQAAWDRHAAYIVSVAPDAAIDWAIHSAAVDDAMNRELLDLHFGALGPTPASWQNCDFADNEPLSPEEEEQAAAQCSAAQHPQQNAGMLF